jgi:hypothetical protein
LDSCEEGELVPTVPSQPLSPDPESESDPSLAADDEGAASAASVGDEIDPPSLDSAGDDDEVEVDPPPLSLDSCEEGELEPTEPSQPPPESLSLVLSLLDESEVDSLAEEDGPAASAASLGDDGESLPPP